jgi:hypothetical protein
MGGLMPGFYKSLVVVPKRGGEVVVVHVGT